ncbi:MAG: Abi family protein, partial [Bacteroidia bacterium]|nr:Abi family protein [Bacteroidia bacterium]
MVKKATTIDEHIEKLKSRGMTLDFGEQKTQEILLDIGYYRLGFYCFPF